jgi:hypothetical protein
MSPIVNTEINMPQDIFDAIVLHETYCVVSGIETITPESVKEWIFDRMGKDLADKFDPSYLFSSPKP